MNLKKIISLIVLICMLLCPSTAYAATYTGTGFIAKAFKIDKGNNISTVTGSILYQKGVLQDTLVFQGITTNNLSAEFTCYVGNSSEKKKIKQFNLPVYNGDYKFTYNTKRASKWTFGKMKIYASNGINYLKCKQG